MIICIESATSICSAALCDSEGVISVRENTQGKSHAATLTTFIQDLLNEAGSTVSDLEAVAVSKGPGSYTGLRIGVSTAKGMAYAASIPLIAVDTTLSMLQGFISSEKELCATDLFCPMLDARRMEVYYALFNIREEAIMETRAEIIKTDSFIDVPETSRIFFFGDGSTKCREVIRRKNIFFDPDFRISASFMQKPAYDLFKQQRFEDTAYFEPFYLKDFLTTKPVKNILRK